MGRKNQKRGVPMSLNAFLTKDGPPPEQPPRFSVEPATNAAFFSYLKILSFQSAGIDIHVTFARNRTAHISMYELGSTRRIRGTWPEDLLIQYMGLTFRGPTKTRLSNIFRQTVASCSGAAQRDQRLTPLFWTTVEARATQHAMDVGFFAPKLTNDLLDISDTMTEMFGTVDA